MAAQGIMVIMVTKEIVPHGTTPNLNGGAV
jgi:hypothetical protein